MLNINFTPNHTSKSTRRSPVRGTRLTLEGLDERSLMSAGMAAEVIDTEPATITFEPVLISSYQSSGSAGGEASSQDVLTQETIETDRSSWGVRVEAPAPSLGQDGSDLLIINNGDGSDFLETDDSARTANKASPKLMLSCALGSH